jgi:murein DD-endopeptidase MepM/ murein hydrolase activator NlpD
MTQCLLFISLFLACTTPQIVLCQEQPLIPAGKTLSFNGRFVHNIPEGYRQISDNGQFMTQYTIGHVGDEVREILDFRLFEGEQLLFSLDVLPGSDLLVSNAGHVSVFDMTRHFNQEVTILLYNRAGELLYSKTFRHASLFGFSPKGGYFGVGTGSELILISTGTGKEYRVGHCSQFSFSDDESTLATAKEGKVKVYQNFKHIWTFNAGFFYPRAVALSGDGKSVSVIDKHHLISFNTTSFAVIAKNTLPKHLSYADLMWSEGHLYAGIHEKGKGTSKGIMQILDVSGVIVKEYVSAERTFRHFDEPVRTENKSGQYESISWPFIPFDQMHTVWNYYEQHMGNGWDTWSYLHQGLDIITPIDEPTYSVQAGWVKCVLTLGGDAYWRVAISPSQSGGYSDGWLYAHLVEGSIQVNVGDYVNIQEYLGDIIYWSDDWGHIHFVEIRDQGNIWYYDDDEWGINFNPLLALTPNTDTISPVIENFTSNSKFGFLVHGTTSTFLNPADLYGNIDIIAKISDFHDSSPWELPAFETFYRIKKLSNNAIVVPTTLGRRLNHSYSFYSGGNYEDYAPLIYHKDNLHLPPSWMSESRNYYQVLTRNDGDTLIHLNDQYLSFPTANYSDGYYMIYIEAWDECGNMAIDSQQVYFNNGVVSAIYEHEEHSIEVFCYPNPAKDKIQIRYYSGDHETTTKINIYMSVLSLVKTVQMKNAHVGWNVIVCSNSFNCFHFCFSFNLCARLCGPND